MTELCLTCGAYWDCPHQPHPARAALQEINTEVSPADLHHRFVRTLQRQRPWLESFAVCRHRSEQLAFDLDIPEPEGWLCGPSAHLFISAG